MAAQPDAYLVLQYLENALEYYIAGRHAYFHRLYRITGNLCHHAVEFLLKAKLLEKYSVAELAERDRFSHNLQRLWRAFNDVAHDPSLAQYDAAIQRLDRFEDIRYPGWPKGRSVLIGHGPTKQAKIISRGGAPVDTYLFILEEVDELVAAIVPVVDVGPDWIWSYFDRCNVLDIYERDNAHQLW